MTTCVASSVDIALLGCGTVGTAFARLAAHPTAHSPVHIATALVRDAARVHVDRMDDTALSGQPEDAPGGVQPAGEGQREFE